MLCEPCLDHPLPGTPIAVSNIMEKACQYLGVPYRRLISKSRRRQIAEARFIVFHLIRNNPHLNYAMQDIADLFGMHHTTVIHGLEKASVYHQVDDNFRKRLEGCHKYIYGSLNFMVI